MALARPEELRPAAASPFVTDDSAIAGDQTGATEPFGSPLAAPSPLHSGACAGLQRNALSDDGLSLEAPGAGSSVRNGGAGLLPPDAGVPSIPSVAQGPRLSSLGRAPEESPFLRRPPLAPPRQCVELFIRETSIEDEISKVAERLRVNDEAEELDSILEFVEDLLEREILKQSPSRSRISTLQKEKKNIQNKRAVLANRAEAALQELDALNDQLREVRQLIQKQECQN